jgi:hypothetical protein
VEKNWRCPRCGHFHVLCPANKCSNCLHPIVISPLSFGSMPVVEFEVVGNPEHSTIIENLGRMTKAQKGSVMRAKTKPKTKSKMWNFDMNNEDGEAAENNIEGQLNVADQEEAKGEYEEETPFHEKM